MTPKPGIREHNRHIYDMARSQIDFRFGWKSGRAAVRRCREILDDLQEPKTAGMQAVVKAIRDLLPKL